MSNFTIEGRALQTNPIFNHLWEMSIINARSIMSNISEDDLILRCKSVTLPGSELVTHTTNFMGVKKEIPIKKNLTQTISCSFEMFEGEKGKGDRLEYKFFYHWSNLIFEQNPKNFFVGNTILTMPSMQLYMRNIIIKQYKYNGEELSNHIKLYNCFPKKISDIELAYEGSATIVKFNIDFTFSHWTLE